MTLFSKRCNFRSNCVHIGLFKPFWGPFLRISVDSDRLVVRQDISLLYRFWVAIIARFFRGHCQKSEWNCHIFPFSSTCKTNFVGYEDLKVHRQLHEGGNRKLTLLVAQVKHRDCDWVNPDASKRWKDFLITSNDVMKLLLS